MTPGGCPATSGKTPGFKPDQMVGAARFAQNHPLRSLRPLREINSPPCGRDGARPSPRCGISEKSTTELTGCRLIWYFVCMKIYKRATKGIVMRLNAKRVMAVGGASVDNDLCMSATKEQDVFAEDFLDGLVWKS